MTVAFVIDTRELKGNAFITYVVPVISLTPDVLAYCQGGTSKKCVAAFKMASSTWNQLLPTGRCWKMDDVIKDCFGKEIGKLGSIIFCIDPSDD